tara:strand:+ start:227 stop:565 length:339 start_codon:yes stop_codon:yes gene_type:complete
MSALYWQLYQAPIRAKPAITLPSHSNKLAIPALLPAFLVGDGEGSMVGVLMRLLVNKNELDTVAVEFENGVAVAIATVPVGVIPWKDTEVEKTVFVAVVDNGPRTVDVMISL